MKNKSQQANWLIKAYLIATFLIGGSIFILGGSTDSFLSFGKSKEMLAILTPVFFGQLTVLYKWLGKNHQNEKETSSLSYISPQLIKLPIILSLGLIIIAMTLRGFSINFEWKWTLSEDTFIAILAFTMSVLNVTNVIVIADLFKTD